MGPYCRAIQHFVIAMAIISSLRGSLTVQAKWSDGLERCLHKR